jgi:putative FmdB family regulatory protein
MPIFEFHCKKCEHEFEELLTLAERENGRFVCPACGSKRIARGFSAFATGTAGPVSGGSFGGGGGAGGGCGSGGFT